MAARFRYNPHTCRYEPVFQTPKTAGKQLLWVMLMAFITATGAFYYYTNRFGLPAEQQLAAEYEQHRKAWQEQLQQLKSLEQTLWGVLERDNQQYRLMLDLSPLSEDQLLAGTGGTPEAIPAFAFAYSELANGYRQLFRLRHRAQIAKQSLDVLHREADRKNQMKESRPAIQPVDNRQLSHLYTTFGLRMHPIFGVLKEHKGLDFSLPKGAPVYASGNGRVSLAHYSPSYGNVVYIDHGFGYETRYAHLHRFIVQAGQYVKRGQVIGYVGNTGISVSPHLHYEVHCQGQPVNPIYFFQRDLPSEEYERLIRKAEKNAGSLD